MKICQECEAEVKEDEETCPRCGSKNIKEEKFCRILGTKLQKQRPQLAVNKKKGNGEFKFGH